MQELAAEVERLEQIVKTRVLSLEGVAGSNEDFQYYTGLPNIGVFNAIFKHLLEPVVPYIAYV